MLVIKNLTLYLIKDLRTILEDFNFSLYEGQKVALIGEEGNGKSSLLKAIADQTLVKSYLEVKGNIYKTNEVIGYLPQALNGKFLSMTTEEYLNKKANWELFDYTEYYDLLNQLSFSESRISDSLLMRNLSGGEKIKFQILCEMIRRPTLLLLDEPSNDLDIDSIYWIESFIKNLKIPVIFISHDEELLENCATSILHIEQLIRKRRPRYTFVNQKYSDYILKRSSKIEKQTQLAVKEKEEYDNKMEKYRQIYERVHYELETVSRQCPSVAKNLKDKMHSVKSMGKRFEKQKENMTQKPDFEESIKVSFESDIDIPSSKTVIDFQLKELFAGELLLSKNIKIQIMGSEKICIIGKNGAGKTTLLRSILKELKQKKFNVGYMPQDYSEIMSIADNAIDFLGGYKNKEELTKIRTYLGSMNFTPEEMFHSVDSLSGGQRAKLFFFPR